MFYLPPPHLTRQYRERDEEEEEAIRSNARTSPRLSPRYACVNRQCLFYVFYEATCCDMIGDCCSSWMVYVIVLPVAAIAVLLVASGLIYGWSYGGRDMSSWALLGAMLAVAGALPATLLAMLTGDGRTVSRHGCGSCDGECCSVWWKDAIGTLIALTLSLVASTAFGAFSLTLAATILYVTVVGEERIGIEVAQWLGLDALYVFAGALSLTFALRFYFKTVDGWYKRGEVLLDGDASNDWAALL